jgi:hypothetical protein
MRFFSHKGTKDTKVLIKRILSILLILSKKCSIVFVPFVSLCEEKGGL